MIKERFGRLSVIMSVLVLMSCGSGSGEQNTEGEEFLEVTEEELVNEGNKVVYYGTPSLVEVASIMEASGADFTPELLNDAAAVANYTTNEKKALNLGVYGADLAYSAMFRHTQESINFLKTIKTLSEEMGLTGAFENELITSIESNISNRDSLLDIVTDFFWSADAYLQDNDRANVAALVIAGGWTESMYLACNMSQNTPNNDEIKVKISEQKLILKNLILFMQEAGKGDEAAMAFNEKLKEVQAIYQGIDIVHGAEPAETSMEDGEMVISNETNVTINQEVLDQLCAKLADIREEIVQ